MSWQAGLLQGIENHLPQVLVGKLPCGKIDRDAYRGNAVGKPLRILAASLTQYPRANLHDGPAFLRNRNEVSGHHHAELRVVPSDQGFHASTGIGVQRDAWLVVQHELIVLECAAQMRFHVDAILQGHAHLAHIVLEAVLAELLGGIHGEISML